MPRIMSARGGPLEIPENLIPQGRFSLCTFFDLSFHPRMCAHVIGTLRRPPSCGWETKPSSGSYLPSWRYSGASLSLPRLTFEHSNPRRSGICCYTHPNSIYARCTFGPCGFSGCPSIYRFSIYSAFRVTRCPTSELPLSRSTGVPAYQKLSPLHRWLQALPLSTWAILAHCIREKHRPFSWARQSKSHRVPPLSSPTSFFLHCSSRFLDLCARTLQISHGCGVREASADATCRPTSVDLS